MGNKKKKSSNQRAADDGLNTAVPEGASDQQEADSADYSRIHQKPKGKRVEADIAAARVGSGGNVEVGPAAGFSTEKHYVEENVAVDRAVTDGSAADRHTIKEAKNVLKKRKHHQSVGDRSVESDGARVLSKDDRDADAAPPQPKHKKFRNGLAPVQQCSADDEQLDSSKVSKKKSFAKAVGQPEAPVTSNSKPSRKNQKSTSKENHENGSASNARAPENTKEPAEQQLAAAKVVECSHESPAEVESSAAAGQSPSKKAKKHKKKKKSSKTEAPAESDVPKVSARDAALAYLDAWKTDKLNWSFQKVRQVWLLQHMYSAADVDDDRFAILLEYLEPMKGKAREETVRKAEEMLAKADDEDTPAGNGSSAPGVEGSAAVPVISELALLRAKEIVQQLSVE